MQAYSTLTRGSRLEDPTLVRVSGRHRHSPAQVLLRWGLQKGWAVLAKSSRPERIWENSDLFSEGFLLDDEDMAALDALQEGGEGRQGSLFLVNVRD